MLPEVRERGSRLGDAARRRACEIELLRVFMLIRERDDSRK